MDRASCWHSGHAPIFTLFWVCICIDWMPALSSYTKLYLILSLYPHGLDIGTKFLHQALPYFEFVSAWMDAGTKFLHQVSAWTRCRHYNLAPSFTLFWVCICMDWMPALRSCTKLYLILSLYLHGLDAGTEFMHQVLPYFEFESTLTGWWN